MSKIFISYRRDDSAATCGRIYERLATHFGRDAVFKDVDDIPYGVRFPDYLAEQLRGCRIALVIIGRLWLTLTTPDGTRRLDAPGDFVRTEIETSLRNGLIVVPILVDNAGMPPSEALPVSIRELVEFNGAQVRYDPDFDTDMQRLIRQLERWLGVTSPATPVGASGGRPPDPTPPADPHAALVTRLLPGIRDAVARQDWSLVNDKGAYLLGEVPAASVPTEVYRLLGTARFELGDMAGARQVLDAALARDGAETDLLVLAARACLRLGDPTAAATHLTRSLALVDDPATRLDLLRTYAEVLLRLKQWDELARRAAEALRLAPNDLDWLDLRLRALREQGQDGEALTFLRTMTARPDAPARWWLERARLARTVTDDDAEVRTALDTAAGLAVPNDPAIAQARRELLAPPAPPLPPISPEQFPDRLATLGFVPRKGKDPDSGTEAAYILPPTVPVAAGPFPMGSDPTRDRVTQPYEPLHTVDLPAFAIARYPVTVAEYACFVRAGQREPANWQDQLREKLDHPVVYVSWHDADAYATWLARLSGQPWRLPSEEEWEKAARWDPRSGTSRIYPWGDTFYAARGNTRESKIGTTTPVGRYGAAGASPCGAEEMAGNVWEWTASLYSSSTDDRIVLRGGSWFSGRQNARTACRYLYRPDGLTDNNGFRLAVAPVRAGS